MKAEDLGTHTVGPEPEVLVSHRGQPLGHHAVLLRGIVAGRARRLRHLQAREGCGEVPWLLQVGSETGRRRGVEV